MLIAIRLGASVSPGVGRLLDSIATIVVVGGVAIGTLHQWVTPPTDGGRELTVTDRVGLAITNHVIVERWIRYRRNRRVLANGLREDRFVVLYVCEWDR